MGVDIKTFNFWEIGKKVLLSFVVVLFLSGSALAIGVWYQGKVTQKTWFDRYNRIEINKVVYTCMPVISVRLPSGATPDAKGKKQVQLLRMIKKGQKVSFKANGHMIYEIMIDEQGR